MAPEARLGTFWRNPDGALFIIAATEPMTVVRPAPGGEVKGPAQETDLAGWTYVPGHDSPTLRCVDRKVAREALRWLRSNYLRDAFADGLTVVAPNAAPTVEYELRAAAKKHGWLEDLDVEGH